MSRRQTSFSVALFLLAFASAVRAGEKYLWAELLAFDNAAADYGVAEYLSRMPLKPKGISLLLTDPEIVHAHKNLERDFLIGDQECAYCARPWNEDRRRQAWTAFQLRGLVAELKRHGIAAYPSFFEFSMDEGYAKVHNAVRKSGFWLDSHPEVRTRNRAGATGGGICIIKRLADGMYYEEFFVGQLVRFLRDYGFAGWHACDGYGHPRLALNDGDFSDDVVGQFVAANPQVALPAGADYRSRADWILANARVDWCRFYARRHAEFIAKAAKALKAEGLSVRLNTSWTCDPFEALYRYGEDYRLLEKAGIDGFYSEASATVLTLEGWATPPISKLDRCRAAAIRLAPSVGVPLAGLACVKDGMEQYNSLRHAPAAAEAESLGLQAIFDGNRMAMPDVLWCLADGIRPDEWRQLDAQRTLLPAAAKPDGVRVVWSDRAHDAELSAYCRDRLPSSFALLAELLHRGAVACSGVRVEEALADESLPLLILNPDLFPREELEALRRRKAAVVMFGSGASDCTFGAAPEKAEPTSWLEPLPARTLPEPTYARAVAEINAAAPAWPDADMADLRVMSYRATNGERIVVALNDRATYLNGCIRVTERPVTVRALTASPSLPVEITGRPGGGSLLHAKIPPHGVVVLAVR